MQCHKVRVHMMVPSHADQLMADLTGSVSLCLPFITSHLIKNVTPLSVTSMRKGLKIKLQPTCRWLTVWAWLHARSHFRLFTGLFPGAKLLL